MNSIIRLVAVVAGLVLMLHGTPSWGQPACQSPGCNPTVSDSSGNTAGGTNALSSVVPGIPPAGFDNTAFGFKALLSNTNGFNNTATGTSALQLNTSGSNNTAIGTFALENNTGDNNTATGAGALSLNTNGANNTASGINALSLNTNGGNNTATGAQALVSNATGNSNTASGVNALFSNTTGHHNTATGAGSLVGNSTGSKNTAIGVAALNQSTGNKNIGIGFQAGLTLTTGNNNVYIGNKGAGDESQTIRIGTAQTQTFIAGIGNAIVTGPNVEVDTDTGQLGISGISSARYKREIESMGARSAGVLQLRPVTFAYRQDALGVVRYGLIAEEVQGVYPELVTHTATGEPLAVRYQELIPMLLNELQRQRQEFQQTLQSQQQALQTQAQALQGQEQVLQRQQQELADLRALIGQGRETASFSR